MTGVRIAPDGRLVEFHAVPSERTTPATAAPDWGPWFKKAHLEMGDFHPAAEHPWVAPVFVEKPFTWVPNDPTNAELPVRVEAGTHRNRVVWFRVTPVWRVPEQSAEARDAAAVSSPSRRPALPTLDA